MSESRRPCLCGNPSCSLEAPPGQVPGLFGDKTVEFGRDPLAFVEANCERYKSRVFLTRLALKQTLVIADHTLLNDFLKNNMDDFYNSFKDNFSDLFGHSIMFAEPEEAEKLRAILLPLFAGSNSTKRRDILHGILKDWQSGLDCSKQVNFYEEFKKISLTYNMEMFMGVQRRTDETFFNEVSELARTHWHGVVSLPVSVSIPLFGSGGYKKAMDAKKKLLAIIMQRLENNDSEFFNELKASNDSVMDKDLLYNHMLLFSCAVIPKGVASVLAMFLELLPKWGHMRDAEGRLSEDDLECVLLEVLRMYPPFTGGLRVALRDTQVGKHHLQAGSTVYYSLIAAMRDPKAFLHPEQFLPGRWRQEEDRPKNLGFSTGPHDCIGRHLAMACIRQMASFLLEHFVLEEPTDLTFPPEVKQLPVLRPKQPHMFTVRTK